MRCFMEGMMSRNDLKIDRFTLKVISQLFDVTT